MSEQQDVQERPRSEAAATPEQQTKPVLTLQQQLEKLRGCKGLSAAVDEGAMTLEAASAEIAKREGKPRSGYQRKKIAMMRLIADHDALKKAYQELAGYSDTLNAECKRRDEEVASLQSMYAALQSDVQLVLAENQRLLDAIAVLRSSAVPPQPPYPQPRPAVPPGLPSLFSRGLR